MLIYEVFQNIRFFEDQNKTNSLIKKYPDNADEIQNEFEWAKNALGNNQRILWYLNLVDAFYSGDQAIFQALLGDYRFSSFATMHTELEHWFAAGYADHRDIRQYKQLANKTVSQVYAELAAIEDAIVKERAPKEIESIPIHEGDTIIVPMAQCDWWWLPRNYCPDESRFMGHCGKCMIDSNNLLSLRDKIPVPHVTFEWDPVKHELYQMKGKKNSKPQNKYHHSILALLLSEYVGGISIDSYQPASDFSIFDMSEQLQQQIAQQKPKLIHDQIIRYPIDFLRAPLSIRMDEEFKSVALDSAPGLMHLMTDVGEINTSHESWENAIQADDGLILYAPISLNDFTNRLCRYLTANSDKLGYLPPEIIRNFDIMKEVVKTSESAIGVVRLSDKRYDELAIIAVHNNGEALQYIEKEKRSPEICMAAVQQNGHALHYVKDQTPEICMAAVQQTGWALEYVRDQTPEICMAAVKSDGNALQYVNDQTPEICMAAVKSDGNALSYVKDKTPEICMAAVQQDGMALEFVKVQTPEICMAAVRQDPDAVKFINREQINDAEYAEIMSHVNK